MSVRGASLSRWLVRLLALVLAEVWLTAAAPARPDHVLVISIDGWPAFYPKEGIGSTPNLDDLRRRGLGGSLRTVFPSMTWPAHVSLVTGARPARHGVLGNRWLDRTARTILRAWEENKEATVRAATVFDVAKAAGLTTAALLWPHTRGAAKLDHNIPELYEADHFTAYVDRPFREELGAAGIPVGLLAKYSETEELPLDLLARDIAVHVIGKHRPRLLLVHFTALDTWMHRHGPRSAQGRWAIEITDHLVGDLLRAVRAAGLAERTAVFVVADHGMLAVRRRVDVNRALFAAGLVRAPGHPDLREEPVWAVENGHMAHVYLLDAERPGLKRRLREALRRLPGLERIIEPRDYARLGLPTPAENPAAGDLVLLARPDTFFGPNPGGEIALEAGVTSGMHGYLPEHPDLLGAFVAAGAGIGHSARPVEAGIIDIAPTILALLGLAVPPTVEGRPLAAALAPPRP